MDTEREHYPALDGLRAYAAMAVLAYHTTIACFWLGWVGVHFFFVLSGFLITGILLKSKEAGNYFKVFYARRFLRIFPIYYLVLFSVLALAAIGGRNIQSAGYYIFYIQNFKLAFHNWDINTFPRWLNHTWTLAIEEQFYIFFPLLVRFLKEKALVIACFILIALSVFTRYYLSLKLPDNTINWGNTVSNLDFLSAGALLAIGIRRIEPEKIIRVLWIAFALFVVAFWLLTHKPFSGPIYLTNLHGQFFFIGLLLFAAITVLGLVINKARVLQLLFENKAAVYVGKISYGLYLYHYPFFLLTDHYCRQWGIKNVFVVVALKFIGSVVVAALSFRFFESRILKWKAHFKYNLTPNP
jgi:peptidoglycan/LPS O-acetylase OafA/YrhL